MSVLLKVVGGIWAILGSANIVMTFRNDVLSSIGAFGLLWNFVLFIFPGLVLYGIGAATVVSHGPLRRATAAPLQAWDREHPEPQEAEIETRRHDLPAAMDLLAQLTQLGYGEQYEALVRGGRGPGRDIGGSEGRIQGPGSHPEIRDKAEVKQIAHFLKDIHEGLCEEEVSPMQLTGLYRVIQRLMDERFQAPDQDVKVLLASLEYRARQYMQTLEERLGVRN
jgi:hypothetical protein